MSGTPKQTAMQTDRPTDKQYHVLIWSNYFFIRRPSFLGERRETGGWIEGGGLLAKGQREKDGELSDHVEKKKQGTRKTLVSGDLVDIGQSRC